MIVYIYVYMYGKSSKRLDVVGVKVNMNECEISTTRQEENKEMEPSSSK